MNSKPSPRSRKRIRTPRNPKPDPKSPTQARILRRPPKRMVRSNPAAAPKITAKDSAVKPQEKTAVVDDGGAADVKEVPVGT